MRISPLAIYTSLKKSQTTEIYDYARKDAALTHAN